MPRTQLFGKELVQPTPTRALNVMSADVHGCLHCCIKELYEECDRPDALTNRHVTKVLRRPCASENDVDNPGPDINLHGSTLCAALVYVTSNPVCRSHGDTNMEQILINLVAGALGGVGAGKSSPTFDLGMIGNTVSGLVGGGVLGQIVTLLLPSIMAAAQSGNLSIGGVISQVVAGGAGGAILTAVIGAIKNRALA
jgi:hypothetical protein